MNVTLKNLLYINNIYFKVIKKQLLISLILFLCNCLIFHPRRAGSFIIASTASTPNTTVPFFVVYGPLLHSNKDLGCPPSRTVYLPILYFALCFYIYCFVVINGIEKCDRNYTSSKNNIQLLHTYIVMLLVVIEFHGHLRTMA